MSTLSPITHESHHDKYWRRPTDLNHAAGDTFCPLSLPELATAVMALPMGFVKMDDQFTLVAIQSLQVNKNLFTSPDGRWLTHYVPLIYRTYPFKLAKADNDTVLLCFDEDSDLLSENTEHEPFFGDEGSLAPNVKVLLDTLGTAFHSGDKLAEIIDLANKHNLIRPWELKVKDGENVQTFEGIYCIDEQSLDSLDNDAFLELREAGALTVIYCQLLSMQHMVDLAKLAEAHAQLASGQSEKITLDELQLDLSDEGGTLDLSNI